MATHATSKTRCVRTGLSTDLDHTGDHRIQSFAARRPRLIRRHGFFGRALPVLTTLVIVRRGPCATHQTQRAMIRQNEPSQNRRHDDDDAQRTVGADGVQGNGAHTRVRMIGRQLLVAMISGNLATDHGSAEGEGEQRSERELSVSQVDKCRARISPDSGQRRRFDCARAQVARSASDCSATNRKSIPEIVSPLG